MEQTERRRQHAVIEEHIRSLHLEIIDAIGVVMAIRKQTDEVIDWHEASMVLDRMHSKLEVTIAGHSRGGMVQYRTNGQRGQI